MRVLIPLDDSPGSERAFKKILNRRFADGVRFKLVSVIEPICTGAEADESLQEMIADAEQVRKQHFVRLLERASDRLKLHFPAAQVEAEVRHGTAATQIIEAAGAWHADRIMMGAHGHDSCPHSFPGSASRAVVRAAPCTVEVLRDLPA